MILLPIATATVYPIVANLRAADRAEVFAQRWSESDDALVADTVRNIQVGFVAANDRGRPVAVVGAAEVLPGLWGTAMMATDEWPTVALAATRHIRRTLMPLLLARGGHRAECRSLSTHAEAHRWLRRLGFVREAVMPCAGRNRETFHLYAWRLSDGWPVQQSLDSIPPTGAAPAAAPTPAAGDRPAAASAGTDGGPEGRPGRGGQGTQAGAGGRRPRQHDADRRLGRYLGPAHGHQAVAGGVTLHA